MMDIFSLLFNLPNWVAMLQLLTFQFGKEAQSKQKAGRVLQ